jgi:hypothetical protein
MKIGDKVRYLNSVGGGIVKGFKGKDIALIEDEDGFEVPALIRECVIIEPAKDVQVRQQTIPAQEIQAVIKPTVTQPAEEYEVEETKEGEQLTVCLAYLPIDRKNMSSTAYECYLVNDSNYFLSVNYMSKTENGWTSRNNGVIEPNTKLFIEEFDKADLNDLERVCLQFIAYKKNKPFELKNTFSIDLRIDTVKFYKLHSFRDNDYFDEDALIYYLVRKDLPEKELKISAEEIELAMKEKEAPRRPRIEPIKKKEKSSSIIEIDLHAAELLDNTNGLSSGDILEYQLGKFHEIMDQNKKNKGQKIVFIHGKGDGVLKNAILKELQAKYKSVYYQDASFREYGYGATMVTIK